MKLDFVITILLTCFAYGCATGPAGLATSPADAEVRERSHQLALAEAARDFERAASFWLPNAVVYMEGAEPIRGLATIRKTYPEFFQPVRSFRGETETITVASSGDLAYETGTNYLTIESPSGLTALTSKYLAVWQRDSDGRWRVAALSLTNNPSK